MIKLYKNKFNSQVELYEAAFPDPKPSFYEIRHSKVSLVLLNNHFSLGFPRPYFPNMIEVGGMQIKQNPAPLSKDILEFLESSENGVIFFSMGYI